MATTTEPQAQSQPAPRKRPEPRLLEVRRVERLTPRMVRVTLGGPQLAGFSPEGPSCHLKIYFPAPGDTLPKFTPDGPRPMSRTYTPRSVDQERQELTLDMLLHGEGPGARFAANAKPGDPLMVAGPSKPYPVDADADWFLLAADESGVPALGTVLEALPAGKPATVFVEVPDDAERFPLESQATLDVQWLQAPDGTRPGSKLADAIASLRLPEGNGRVWLACEASAMRDIRRNLLHERKVPADRLYTRGYWQLGESNHPDHDYGQDIT